MSQRRAELAASGFFLERNVFSIDDRTRLLLLTAPEHVFGALRHPSGVTFAARGLLEKVPALSAELETCGVNALAAAALGEAAVPIDAISFDKHADANWTVPAHQDRIVPVAESNASKRRVRDGVGYGEPARETLASLVALRIHFDATDGQTGALCLLPGSHLGGVLSAAEIQKIPLERFQPCPANAGDVLIMRPLLLHRSSPSRGDGHRRVLHVVYAPTMR